MNEHTSQFTPASKLGKFILLKYHGNNDLHKERDRIMSLPEVKKVVSIFHTSNDMVPFVPTGLMHLRLFKETSAEEFSPVLKEYQLKITKTRSESEFIIKTTATSAYDPVEIAAKLQKNPLVEIAEPDMASVLTH